MKKTIKNIKRWPVASQKGWKTAKNWCCWPGDFWYNILIISEEMHGLQVLGWSSPGWLDGFKYRDQILNTHWCCRPFWWTTDLLQTSLAWLGWCIELSKISWPVQRYLRSWKLLWMCPRSIDIYIYWYHIYTYIRGRWVLTAALL